MEFFFRGSGIIENVEFLGVFGNFLPFFCNFSIFLRLVFILLDISSCFQSPGMVFMANISI